MASNENEQTFPATTDSITGPTTATPKSARRQTPSRPGWPEILAAGLTYVLLVLVGGAGLRAIPAVDGIAKGLYAYGLSAGAGIGAWGLAVLVRIRKVRLVGMKRVPVKWLLVGAVCGVGAFGLSILAGVLFSGLTGNSSDVQGIYRAAANGGVLSLIATLILGAVATPIGEEAAFRGVLANALGRYGAWVSVLGSAAVFAVAHGFNLVLPVAFVEGLIAALLFRRTGSIWPGVFVHLVNNTLATILPLILMAH